MRHYVLNHRPPFFININGAFQRNEHRDPLSQ
jgi:hypothetical protein